MLSIAERTKQLKRSEIRKMFELAKQYDNVINFGIGEPAFDTPKPIVEQAFQAALKGATHYTSNLGDLELRRKIAAKLKRDNQIEVDPEKEVIVTVGAMEALSLCLLAVVNPGDEVIIPNPGWLNYEAQILLAGGVPVPAPVREENQFVLQAADLAAGITGKTKAIIINSPNNPTGAVFPREELVQIGRLARENRLLVISDEVYEKIIFAGGHFSLASEAGMREHVISIFSFSKAYAMTGWRVGYAAGPEAVIQQMVKIHENIAACAPSVSQKAAAAALGMEEETARMTGAYRENMRLLVDGLNAVPKITCIKPKGTFYAFANIRQCGKSSPETARELLEQVQVVTVPGSAFGSGGEGFLRLSFACSKEEIKEGLRRIDRYMRGAGKPRAR